MSLINLLIFIGLAILFFGMSVGILVLMVKNRKLTKVSVQSQIDNFILLSELDKMVQEKDNKAIEQSDGFLKFVSESRDWAFEYIEDIQQALMAYDIAVGLDDAKILNEAYQKLISFLPKEDDASIS